jgi:hypothetical protein
MTYLVHVILVYLTIRFTQDRLLFKKHSEYQFNRLDYAFLNTLPDQWVEMMALLSGNHNNRDDPQLVNNNWVTVGQDLVYYSKHENLTSFNRFDWIITENAT